MRSIKTVYELFLQKLQGALSPHTSRHHSSQGSPLNDCGQNVDSLKTKSEGPGDWQDALGEVKRNPSPLGLACDTFGKVSEKQTRVRDWKDFLGLEHLNASVLVIFITPGCLPIGTPMQQRTPRMKKPCVCELWGTGRGSRVLHPRWSQAWVVVPEGRVQTRPVGVPRQGQLLRTSSAAKSLAVWGP